MANIGRILKKKGVSMTLLSLVLIGSGCEEQIDPVKVPSNEGKQVEVSLNIGFADEVDGTGNGTSPATKSDAVSNRSAFEVLPIADVRTKAQEGKPDKIYNLEIIQYKSDGTAASQILGEQQIGQSFTVSLAAENQSKLLFIAWGSSSGFNTPTDKSLKTIQELKVKAKDSKINQIATDATGSALANMPYFLYLEDVNIVNVNGINKIQSPEGKDVRLLLQRLAVKVQLDWSLSQNMKNAGYSLREVKLCQAPADYRLIPQAETTPQWGDVYPSSVAEFVDLYRLTGGELSASNTKTVWMPANSRGISPKATAPIYRNKENANPAATYAEFVVDHTTDGKNDQRLYYRAYLGGNTTDDFNLLENTNYHWKININTAEYANDQRIQPLDLTPVFSENLQTTANCFMMKPGTNICFNPYQHDAEKDGHNNNITDGWNPYLISNGSINKQITKVKVVWQSKDNATSGDLVMGYSISSEDHSNLVNLTNGNDKDKARIHVKVANSQGGNAIIAAYNNNGEIVWSWHLWITDYEPQIMTNNMTYEQAQQLTRNGTVHQYPTDAFTSPKGKHYKKVSMDRNLCATAGGFPGKDASPIEFSKRIGYLYCWGRKDPFFGTVDGTTNEIGVIYDAEGYSYTLPKVAFSSDLLVDGNTLQYTIQHPATFIQVSDSWYDDKPYDGAFQYLYGDSKTLYDPCPAGWKTPHKDIYAGVSMSKAYWYNVSGDFVETATNDRNPLGGRLYNLNTGENGVPAPMTIHNTAWFPVTGSRGNMSGDLATSNGAGYAATSTIGKVTNFEQGKDGRYHFYYLRYADDAVNLVNGNGSLSAPDPYRCVQR